MKFISALIITVILAAMLQMFLPWWIIAAVSFAVGFFIQQTPLRSFAGGFLGIFLLWLVYCLVIDYNNGHVLTPKVAQLLKLPNIPLLFFVTAFIGGIVSGLAALSGSFLKKITLAERM